MFLNFKTVSRQIWIGEILVTFLIALTKYLTRRNLRKKGFIGTQSKMRVKSIMWTSHHSRNVEWLVTMCLQETVQKNAGAQLMFDLLSDLSPWRRLHYYSEWLFLPQLNPSGNILS